MKVSHNLAIVRADFVGTCQQCGQPSTGSYDIDESPMVRVECASCHFTNMIEIKGKVEPKRRENELHEQVSNRHSDSVGKKIEKNANRRRSAKGNR